MICLCWISVSELESHGNLCMILKSYTQGPTFYGETWSWKRFLKNLSCTLVLGLNPMDYFKFLCIKLIFSTVITDFWLISLGRALNLGNRCRCDILSWDVLNSLTTFLCIKEIRFFNCVTYLTGIVILQAWDIFPFSLVLFMWRTIFFL